MNQWSLTASAKTVNPTILHVLHTHVKVLEIMMLNHWTKKIRLHGPEGNKNLPYSQCQLKPLTQI